MIWPFNKLKQWLINYYTIKEIKNMPDDMKTQGLKLLASQTPRVLIAIITLACLVGMAWFGKLTDVLAGCLTITGGFAQWMNFKVLAMAEKEKEGEK